MLVAISRVNIASMAIYEALKELKPDTNFLMSDKGVLEIDTSQQEANYIIVASTHKSKDERKTLSVHPTGNFAKAELGGKDKTLSKTSSHLFKKFFQELKKQAEQAELDYEVTMEATHHGPYISRPSLFIEIGSSEKQWKDPEAAKVIAKTIISASERFQELEQEEEEWQTAIAFGGGHYCQSFNKHQLGDKYAISHICSKHNLPFLDEELIKQAIEKTEEKVELVLLDWKGLSGYKEKVIKLLKKLKISYEKA